MVYRTGMTDAGCTVVLQTKDSKSGSVGFLLNNMQMKITDIKTEKTLGANQMGEIRFNVPTVMNGYYKNPEATKQAFDSDGIVPKTFYRNDYLALFVFYQLNYEELLL